MARKPRNYYDINARLPLFGGDGKGLGWMYRANAVRCPHCGIENHPSQWRNPYDCWNCGDEFLLPDQPVLVPLKQGTHGA